MPILVHSPFSGRPVKIRDQDIGRALRDDQGRVFYAIPRTDGQGYYAAPTRHGSDKDEQHYLDMLEKGVVAKQVGAERSAEQVHDATGKPRSRRGRWALVVLLLILAAAAAGYWWFVVQGHPLPEFLRPLSQLYPSPPPRTEPAPPPSIETEPVVKKIEVEAVKTPLSPEPPAAQRVMDHSPPRPLALPGAAASAQTHPVPPRVVADASAAVVKPMRPTPPPTAPAARPRRFISSASGLRYRVDEPGDGHAATAGSFVIIDYLAMLPDGTVVDTTEHSGPIGFVLWSGQVIRGWDEGVAGMRVGEKRTLIIPPNLVHPIGGGSDSAMPARTTLHTVVRLRDVRPGVTHTIDRPGDGPLARPGDTVTLHYNAFVDGRERPFDGSRPRRRPIQFQIGANEVIQGWELGVTGMAQGEKRTITIPPYLGYGKRGFGAIIPPHATLRYEIELLRVE